MEKKFGEFQGFISALMIGLPAGMVMWLVAYELALMIFFRCTGIDLPRLRLWL